jgi:drug/metabolite transporter (DMT)-like permease
MASVGARLVRRGWTTAAWRLLGIFLALNLAACVCFKEGGTNPDFHWLFFVVGNVFGIASTWFVMRLYQQGSANVVMALTSSLGFVSVQLVYWWLYRSPLDLLQWGGIGIVLVGTLMAAWTPGPVPEKQAASATVEDGA